MADDTPDPGRPTEPPTGRPAGHQSELLALLDSDPAAGILAVADLREQRALAASPGPWRVHHSFFANHTSWYVDPGDDATATPAAHCAIEANAEHIAAEANPDHALAAVGRWRGVVERHWLDKDNGTCDRCVGMPWPCPDLTETADEAKAYLGGVR